MENTIVTHHPVCFQTPGIIEDFAFDTFGLSIKETDNAIGRFGTGLKYCIAIVLSEGGSVTLWRGIDEHIDFTLEKTTVRGKEVSYICANDRKLPFTTNLGAHWQMWMAFREAYANTLDESGSVGTLEEQFPQDGFTTLVIDHPEFYDAFMNRDEIIIPADREVVFDSPYVTCYKGESPYVYYRGVRAGNAENMSMYTWSLKMIDITEDRTFESEYTMRANIARAIVMFAPDDVMRRCIRQGTGRFEESLDYDTYIVSRTFIEVARDMTDKGDAITPSALQGLSKNLSPHERLALEVDDELSSLQEEQLADALTLTAQMGFRVHRDNVIIKEKLPMAAEVVFDDERICFGVDSWNPDRLAASLILFCIERDRGIHINTREMTFFLVNRLISCHQSNKSNHGTRD